MSEESMEYIIETEGVKVNFGDFWALKGVDIKVRRGEIIVILGRPALVSRLTSGP